MTTNTHRNAVTNYTVLMNKLNGQSEAVKAYALQILLASQLKGIEKQELSIFIKNLQNTGRLTLEVLESEVETFISAPEHINQKIHRKLQHLLDILDMPQSQTTDIYTKLDEVISRVELITNQLKSYSLSIGETSNDLDTMLVSLSKHETQRLEATYRTVQHITQRTIESLDPDNSYKYLDNSVRKTGPLKKVAMFDAAKDKYDQVKEYYEEGKMLRDFKVFYKQALKKEKGS